MVNRLPIFITLVLIIRNHGRHMTTLLSEANLILSKLVLDYEIVVVDNASDDNSLNFLKALTSEEGLPNLQVYALTKEVDADTAAWVGLENALGDFVAVLDPLNDDMSFLPEMLDKAVSGFDVVFATNQKKSIQSLPYRSACVVFDLFYKLFSGIHLVKEAPQYRVLTKNVINYILKHKQPSVTYRHLPATGGFSKINISYTSSPKTSSKKRLIDSIDRGMRLLVLTSRGPMRLVTLLSLFGAIANLFYSIYVVAVAFLKVDVAAGWVSLSLQQSGMFFLLSLVLLVLGEYILNIVSLQNEIPLYHVGQEFTSVKLNYHEKLNIEGVFVGSKKIEAHSKQDAE